MAGAKKPFYTDDVKVEQQKDIILDGGPVINTAARLEVIDKPIEDDHMMALAFMEQELVITVNETEDQNAENPVKVGCNGQEMMFWRGRPTKAKRKFVDCLIVKSGRVSTVRMKNGAGEDTYGISQRSAHKYPFMVHEDPSPKGHEWLMQRLSEIV